MDLALHLKKSSWIIELEEALKRFSIRTYLDWFDQHHLIDQTMMGLAFPEKFLYYLKDKVSNPCSKTKFLLQLLIQGKSDLYHHHCLSYLKHVMSSIDSPPTREKFRLMSTVAFILQEPFTSLRRGIKHANWKKICATLFGFSSAELKWDNDYCFRHLIDPTSYKHNRACFAYAPSPMYGHLAETQRFIPELILSHRLANVAISCMQYLQRLDFNTLPTQNHFLASWATRSKQLPWLWRRRMRVILRRRRPIWNHDAQKYSFPQKQIIYSEIIQSHQEQRIFYTWTLDLLYHTLQKAMKSDVLTRALSKPFIPSLAPILFPRRVKRVRKAAAAYLEKVSRRTSCLGRSDDEHLHS